MSPSLKEVKLNQSNNALVPTVAKNATKIDVAKNKNEDELKTEVRSVKLKMMLII